MDRFAAYHHDVAYFKIDKMDISTDEKVKLKNEADDQMVKRLEQYNPDGVIERAVKFFVIKILQIKSKLGLGFKDNPVSKGNGRDYFK